MARYASFRQKIAINKKLEEVCLVVNGMAQYKTPWDDNKVADFINYNSPPKEDETKMTRSHVSNVRYKLFGSLVNGPKSGISLKELDERITDLEDLITCQDINIAANLLQRMVGIRAGLIERSD